MLWLPKVLMILSKLPFACNILKDIGRWIKKDHPVNFLTGKKWFSNDTFRLSHILLVIYHWGKMYPIAVEDWGILLREMVDTSVLGNFKKY